MKILLDISGMASLHLPDGETGEVQFTLVVSEHRGMRSGEGTLHGDISFLHKAFLKGQARLATDAGPEAEIIIKRVSLQSAEFLTTGPVKGF